jgi:hypothetical protein
MRREVAAIAIAGVLLVAAGCRQSDGPIPTPVDEQPNKIEDIGHDLQHVGRAEADAERDLLDDLDGLDENTRPASMVQKLGTALATAVKGKSLSDAQAQNLSQKLFVALTAEELNAKQIDQVAGDLRTTLVSAGVESTAADNVAAAATELQSSITLNRKRWYHIF